MFWGKRKKIENFHGNCKPFFFERSGPEGPTMWQYENSTNPRDRLWNLDEKGAFGKRG